MIGLTYPTSDFLGSGIDLAAQPLRYNVSPILYRNGPPPCPLVPLTPEVGLLDEG